MTVQRLQQVLDALYEEGWVLLGQDEYDSGNKDPFVLEDEVIRWGLTNPNRQGVLELEFQAFGHLGGTTQNLNDILCCKYLTTGELLHFARIKSPDWHRNLRLFIEHINHHPPHSDDDY